jgi:hypothetical protein
MSWMSPSYVLQNGFDTSWSPLARRYSLWLYREVGWDSNQVGHSLGASSPFLAMERYRASPYCSSQEMQDHLAKYGPLRLLQQGSSILHLKLFPSNSLPED